VPTAVVLSHAGVAHELGHLGPWLEDGGFAVTRILRESPSELPPADLLIVMGSPASVAAGHCGPAAQAEIDAIATWLDSGRPYLGICFGAQALAVAAGGAVTRLPETFRAYARVDVSDGVVDAVAGPWAVWHEDAITAPASADLLGSLDHADLAFRVGRAWGLQPHVEVDAGILERMAIALGATPDAYEPIVAQVRADDAANAVRARALLDAFAQEVLAG
jgi:GMP synthase (glutamine-hydrolysing)